MNLIKVFYDNKLHHVIYNSIDMNENLTIHEDLIKLVDEIFVIF